MPAVRIAHRGLSDEFPENSLAALTAAAAVVPVIEFDVRCTHDGVLVCTHDADLARTHQQPVRIGETSFNELRTIAPEVPTLDEALSALGDTCGIILDVKARRPRAIDGILATIEASSWTWHDPAALRKGIAPIPGSAVFQSSDAELVQAVAPAVACSNSFEATQRRVNSPLPHR
jgi:glycerophosphoryl diester phosphodiesterase